jgi:NADH-quinone oxidoreductase subunit J
VQKYVFVAVALATAAAAVRLVTTRNVVHAALSLLVVLAGVAALFLLFTAEFLGWVQVLIYVGAVIVLLLFGLMLTRAPIGGTAMDTQMRGIAAVASGLIFVMTSSVLWKAFEGRQMDLDKVFSIETLGTTLFTRFVLPFEVVSVLLLAALVGAVVLARKEEDQ